ncbi:lysis system i-spanin subunit Rz [Metapseudomonas otitidis]|uniref:lysis system i-spanin subunit Rz n=1 Tax=Metapseudomonas otitidis TaxID=319939 RepID=UPI0013F674B4|nr:lysis system i-spanin subunit Rz [Pseudomonas otitidis]
MKALIAKAVGAFFVVALVIGLTFAWGYSVRDNEAQQEALTAQNTYLKQLEEQRKAAQGELDGITKEWQAALAANKRTAAGTVAQLRADGVRLRVELADARVCAVTGNCGRDPDGRAELSDRAAEFLVGQAKRADDQVKALQGVIRVLQKEGDHEQ